MREDQRGHPLVRQFILLPKGAVYSPGDTPVFTYTYEEHEYLSSIMTIMEHADAIYEASFNSVKRYNFTEEFVSYLIGES